MACCRSLPSYLNNYKLTNRGAFIGHLALEKSRPHAWASLAGDEVDRTWRAQVQLGVHQVWQRNCGGFALILEPSFGGEFRVFRVSGIP
jgi:hypothetical protein